MDRRSDRNIGTFARACLPAFALAGALLTLAGCGSLGITPPSPAELALACPRVSIVRDLQTVTLFRPGPGRDLTDVVARAAITDYVGNCEYGSDGVTVNLVLIFGAEKGGAWTPGQNAFRYFVAVVPPGQEQPAAKQQFDLAVKFPEGATFWTGTEELAPRVPLPKDVNAKDWEVVVGFQLTPEQLDYNRLQAQRPRGAGPQS